MYLFFFIYIIFLCVFACLFTGISIRTKKAHKSGWNCMMVWSWHVGRQRQKHCMFDVEPKLSHNEFVVCPPTIYILLEMLISKYSGQDACCLHVLMDCIFQEHCLAQTDGSWTLKLGPLAPCHPTVHPDWMPGTPIDFSTVCHAKSGRLGRRMQELHKHFPWQFQIAKQINILVQWFPGSHLACGFLDASWSLWIRVKQDPALWAWKLWSSAECWQQNVMLCRVLFSIFRTNKNRKKDPTCPVQRQLHSNVLS